jgi:hypothetical protein
MDARFLMTDIVRAIRDKSVLRTSADYIVRDYIHPSDFFSLVNAVLSAPAVNTVIDAFSKAPIDKSKLLTCMNSEFGLKFELDSVRPNINATGIKSYYYSINHLAKIFNYQPIYSSLESILLECAKIF